jgi:hypothetical protein
VGSENVSLVADVATAIAASIAAVGLFLTWRALVAQRRSTDLGTMLALASLAREAEARVSTAEDLEKRQQELVNYLNFLEVYAAAVNERLLEEVTMNLARDRIVNDLAILSVSADARERVKCSITSSETFSHIQKFWKNNRVSIELAINRERARSGLV